MDAMGIAEEIAPLFKSKITDRFGNQARFTSVHTIDYTKKVLEDIVEYDINIHILSDQGDLFQSVIVREYANKEIMMAELDRYTEIVGRCMLFRDLDPNPLVKVDKERGILILEKVDGFNLNRLNFSQDLKNFILGRIYGILHGDEIQKLDDQSMRDFMEFLLGHLPFTDEEKKSINIILDYHLTKFKQNFGGFISLLPIKPKDLIFQISQTDQQLDRKSILLGDVLHASVKCQVPDELTTDRMQDIANYFHKKSYYEFIQTGGQNSTISEMKDFLDGYRTALKVHKLPPLSDLYLSGITLDIQLIFVAWMKEGTKIQVGEIDPDKDPRDLLRYTYYLLKENPFDQLF
ncbi:MAG: hypothetical protein HeimC2_00690 [Candidatus Heimdallarchaeota archaeon LC_2]|nr:MAG: hypothetical protein HeimC2_00690 [Candidatus Heimdallarchaeota archaeon LC_2]